MKSRLILIIATTMTMLVCIAHASTMVREDANTRSVENLQEKYEYRYNTLKDGSISASEEHVLGLRNNGTVIAAGKNLYGECNVDSWTDIVAVSTGAHHSLGLCSDGTVVACGDQSYGQCDVSGWQDIVAICASERNSVGLTLDGSVVVAGDDTFGQMEANTWKNMVSIATSDYVIAGLRADGTIIRTGDTAGTDAELEGEPLGFNDLLGLLHFEDWGHVVCFAGGARHFVGLRDDGMVLACGDSGMQQTDTEGWPENIISVSAANDASIGWTAEGTLEMTPDFAFSQGEPWKEVIAVSFSRSMIVGLKTEGSVICDTNREAWFDDLSVLSIIAEIKQWGNIGRDDVHFQFKQTKSAEQTVPQTADGENGHWDSMLSPDSFMFYMNMLIDAACQGYLTGVGHTELIEDYQNYLRIVSSEAGESLLYYDNEDWTVEVAFYYGEEAVDSSKPAQMMSLILKDQIAAAAAPVMEEAFLYALSISYPDMDVDGICQWINEQEFQNEEIHIADNCTLTLLHFDRAYQYRINWIP